MRMLVIVLFAVVVCYGQGSVLKFEQNDILKNVMKGLNMQDEGRGILSEALGKPGLVAEKQDAEQNEVVKAPGVKPWYCHDLDCPTFTLIENATDYELREYDVSSWVTTSLTGVDLKLAQYEMFMKLFGYISGNNKAGEKIKMTCPVIIRIIPGQGPTCENNFTMSFFNVPNKTPPQPTAKDVAITALPKLRAYVRSFSGMPGPEDWISEAAKLAASLPNTATYIKEFYYTGGYDAPFTLFNRHNEIWFINKLE